MREAVKTCPPGPGRRAYMQVQGTRPQTIAHALTDSPAGLLAWIVEKFQEWTDPAAKLPEDAVDRDRILTDVSIYWFTATAGSAAHTYYERFNDPAMWTPRERSAIPVAVAVFTTDVTVRPFAAKAHDACAGRRRRALVGVRPRRPLRRPRSPGPAHRRRARVLPQHQPITGVLSERRRGIESGRPPSEGPNEDVVTLAGSGREPRLPDAARSVPGPAPPDADPLLRTVDPARDVGGV